ncbi:uncharacterized protein K460DRAFT_394029 [Cucurbitaria berberidis CBS 394.84]|uniref:Uncharacterized protein n=1 Tax=Cucurbitaria berberidis CBS 394.84 TaxID=1168544 RepID=A0A9P4LB35_9PLEO|nr:uncharacterized protein K460DRAFT_394029 [Cucurbitaria berberidis CBS 394.84]KAF1849126.1 hypothetical protein K460DRAFT_394029 [Cucurbitaria berberidis CBS 394.84]
MASFFAAPRLDLSGSVNTASTSTWSFRTAQQGTPFSTSSSSATGGSLFGLRTTNANMSSHGIMASPKVQELSYECLVKVPAPKHAFPNSSGPLKDTLKHPSTVPNSNTEILRIYLPFDNVPLSWLNALLVHIHQQTPTYPPEIQLCVRSLLRPYLQDIDENPKLAYDLTDMLRKGLDLGTPLKFFFLRPSVQAGSGRDCFADFVEKDLLRAIEGLREHDVELSDILGEESCLFNHSVSAWHSFSLGSSSSSQEDLDDELL